MLFSKERADSHLASPVTWSVLLLLGKGVLELVSSWWPLLLVTEVRKFSTDHRALGFRDRLLDKAHSNHYEKEKNRDWRCSPAVKTACCCSQQDTGQLTSVYLQGIPHLLPALVGMHTHVIYTHTDNTHTYK